MQLNDAPDRGDLANYQAQAHLAEISLQRSQSLRKNNFASQETVDQNNSQLGQMDAMIQKTEAIIAQKLIRAPFSGELGVRQIDLGQYLTAGAPIVTLTDLSTLYVNFTLASHLRPEIAVGQKVNVTADAFPGRVFTAKITTIEPQVSADTRSMEVEATMKNPGNALLPGMFVNAAVVLPPQPGHDGRARDRGRVHPLWRQRLCDQAKTARMPKGNPVLQGAVRTRSRPACAGTAKSRSSSGLKPGEQVVAAGQVKLQSGVQVAVTGAPPPQPPQHPTLQLTLAERS